MIQHEMGGPSILSIWERATMKVSVVIITYNHERFIAQAIESALAQDTNFDYEIIIGEDCSTDATRAVVKDFHRRYPGQIVPLFRDNNLGMMRNLMETLATCRGRYVAFLEGDDRWEPRDKIQRQADFLDANPDFAICCGRARVQDEGTTGVSELLPTANAGTYTITDLLKGNFIYTCTCMCRWGLLKHLPKWFEKMKLGDWPLCALLAQFGKIKLFDDVLAVYRVHPGGVWSSRPMFNRIQESIRMLDSLNAELGFRYKDTICETIARFYMQAGYLAWQNGSRSDTARCLVNCLRNGGGKLPDIRPNLRGLAWYTLFGSWLPTLTKARRAITRS
jgi:glycosyltransferase involved in cell wall biosynthesis